MHPPQGKSDGGSFRPGWNLLVPAGTVLFKAGLRNAGVSIGEEIYLVEGGASRAATHEPSERSSADLSLALSPDSIRFSTSPTDAWARPSASAPVVVRTAGRGSVRRRAVLLVAGALGMIALDLGGRHWIPAVAERPACAYL
jgi:hypothetical protein